MKIYVENLPRYTTEASLEVYFASFWSIASVKLLDDSSGLVEFFELEDFESALSSNLEFGDHELVLHEAVVV